MSEWDGKEKRHHPTVCLHEHEWGEIQQYIKNQDERWIKIEDKVCRHIDEGERPGGVRERLLIVEQLLKAQRNEISVIKQGYWKVGLACGFIGALLGNIAPEAFRLIATWIVGK